MPDLVPVNSSNVSAIEFKNGGKYVYCGISADQHQELIGAKSIGSHLHKIIKPAAKLVKKV